MQKILHVVPLSRRAGVQVMFINFLKYVKNNKPEILKNHIVLAMNHSDDIVREIENIGVQVYKAKRRNKYDITVLFKIRKIIKYHNINVVYGQNSTGNIWAYFITLVTKGLKLVCHEHGTSWNASGFNGLMARLWGNKARVIIANSLAAKTMLTKKFKLDEGKIHVVYNGVPMCSNNIHARKKKAEQLLYVGRLDDVKSPKTLIHMISHLKDDLELSSVNLIILGDGYLKEELISLSRALGVDHMIDFKGSVPYERVLDYMSESALLILPSIREPLGNVIIEAATQKTATVATNIDGIPEVIEHNRTGILISPEIGVSNRNLPTYVINPDDQTLVQPKSIDPRKLAKQVKEIILDNRFEELGLRAFQEIPKRFSMSKYYFEICNYLNIKE